jgi:hypothetical protein
MTPITKRKWLLGFVAFMGAVGAGAAFGLASRHRYGLGDWRKKYDDKWGEAGEKAEELEARARGAGARGKLTFVGAGGEGTVLCDEHGKAFKIGRRELTLRDEAAWMAMASKIASIKQHIPRDVRYDADNDVIVRECLTKKVSGRRLSSTKLWDLHQRLTTAVMPYGRGRPEFKEDSYVITRRGPVLVDAGFAVKYGQPLVQEALDIINERKAATPLDVKQMGWDITTERGKSVPASVANKLLRRLQVINPEVEL